MVAVVEVEDSDLPKVEGASAADWLCAMADFG